MVLNNDFNKDWDTASKYFKEGNHERAIELFKELYGKNPNEHACLLKIGFSYVILKKPKKVVQYFEKYLSVPISERKQQKRDIRWGIYHNLGIAYYLMDNNESNLEKAYKYFQDSIEIEPKPKSLLYLGEIAMELGEENLAVSYWRTAAKKGSGAAILALNSRGYEV